MAYKINLTEEQKSYIYAETNCKNKQNKLKSVWVYLIKYENEDISINRLYDKYKRHHMKISRRYFFELVNLIKDFTEEINMCKSDVKINQKNQELELKKEIERCKKELEIAKRKLKMHKKSHKKMQTENPSSNSNITIFEGGSKKHKNKDLNIYTNNNTLNTEIVAPVELVVFADKLLKEFRIKSEFVKNRVYEKLRKCTHINRNGMVAYITKVIADAKAIMEQNRKRFIINLNAKKREMQILDNINNAKKLGFNNFEARNYDYADLENRLLGWD